MELNAILSSMTLEIRDRLSSAVETGRWPDGSVLTDDQKRTSLKAVIAWDAAYGEETDEPFKIQKGGAFNNAATMTKPKPDITIIKTLKK